ncbi:hypothetical protein N7527_005900 [Penicillium freii]|uniref:Uncharacterized protein n=1 Tax=Penicillium freii TaxID=48697 RepID=A0A101MMN5_PENFR|nr:hypothetical protein N7465_004240 [Penicillium sp. CMV-2018d]KAJ5521785.1 hypothetical protein N7527_005900 [Penicillium freii]KAJ5962168.1 hypothetical protein N7501_007109 [Penicillium viridicatum]KUM63371.1 hypothetical protein ACN42_g3692 [Penicillium freii]
MVGYGGWHIRLSCPQFFFLFLLLFHHSIDEFTLQQSQTDKYILPFLWEPWILFGWAHYPSGIKVSQVTSGYEPVFVLASVVNPMSPDIRFIFGVGSF